MYASTNTPMFCKGSDIILFEFKRKFQYISILIVTKYCICTELYNFITKRTLRYSRFSMSQNCINHLTPNGHFNGRTAPLT
jgi:hypothetical protein